MNEVRYNNWSRDPAVDRQDFVDSLHRMLDGVADLKNFSINFRLAIKERVWEHEREFAGGTRQPPVPLHTFIHEHYPVGLGATYLLIENLIRDDNETLLLWTEVSKREPGRPEKAIAEWCVSHGGQDDLSRLIDNLIAYGAKSIAIEIKKLIGQP